MNSGQVKTIYFITGASGVGKTTLVNNLAKKHRDQPWSFLHFDSIEIPSLATMQSEFGSPSEWQKTKTLQWIQRLVNEYNNEKIFFEGQVAIRFIAEGFASHNFVNYQIILLDCSEEVMRHRLTVARGQPELFTENMKKWLQYLRTEASASSASILNTDGLSPGDIVKQFEKIVGIDT